MKRTTDNVQRDEMFLSVEQALNTALEIVKGNKVKRDKVYVWRQRFKEGKLSHGKIQDILSEAGFKRVVEEKWMLIPTTSNEDEYISEQEPFPREEVRFPKEK